MRQAFRRYAFPMMIIAAVLAAALPLNCFAAERVYFTNDFASTILNIQDFPYLSIPSFGLTDTGIPERYFSYSPNTDINYSVFCREFYLSNPYMPVSAVVNIPLFLNDISSFNLTFFVGILNSNNSSVDQPSYNENLNFNAAILTTPNEPIDLSISPALDVNFTASDSSPGEFNFFLRKYSVSFSSSSLFDVNYFQLICSLDDFNDLPPNYTVIFGISDQSSITTVTGGSSSVIKSLEIMARLFESFIAAEIQTDSQILDKLDDIIDYFTSNGSSGGESEDILEEGAEKQEQLEQLGDALSNVPKPSIQNITQSFDPADTLISADPGMIQNALSIVYSWDKFLILLGLFIAVGTISYIIFGKKS